jgi:hypothetical protein
MATFSPSPTPRRTIRRLGGHSPPVKIGNSRPTSRFATPGIRVSDRYSAARDVASLTPGMDVDSVDTEWESRSEIVFAKSDEMVVSFGANLPIEVKQVLRNTGTGNFAPFGSVATHLYCRLLQRALHWCDRHGDWVCPGRVNPDLFCMAIFSSTSTASSHVCCTNLGLR